MYVYVYVLYASEGDTGWLATPQCLRLSNLTFVLGPSPPDREEGERGLAQRVWGDHVFTPALTRTREGPERSMPA